MPERDIRARIKLEGEQQFKSAMKAASDAIKVLNSEQKLAQAQFDATGDKEQFLTDKTDILRRKIEEQQKAVNAAQEAVNKLREKGIDPSNKSMQEWTTKLNNSKAQLTRLKGDLDSTESELRQQGEAFDEASDGAASYNEQLGQIGKGVDFSNTINSLTAIQSKLNASLNAVKTIATDIYNAELQAAQWADDLNTAATKAGMDAETYQSWSYAAKLIDTEVDAIIKSQDRLLQSMTKSGAAGEEANAIFNRLGVVTRNTDGTLRDANAVFWDVVDALGKTADAHGNLFTETDKDQVAQELFGRSYRELLPLIKTGRSEFDKLAEEGREYATVSQENVDKLNKLNDANDRLNAKLNKLRTTTLANLAPAFTTTSEKAGELVDKFNAFLETDEGKEALDNLAGAIEGLLKALTPDDFGAVINGAAQVVRNLTGALEWISKNGWTIVAILGGMKAAVAGIEVTKTFLQMLQLLQAIKWRDMASAKGVGDALGKGATAAGDGAAASTAGRLGQLLKSIAEKVAPALSAAAPWAAFAAATGAASYGLDKYAVEQQYGDYNRTLEHFDQLVKQTSDARITALQNMMIAYAQATEQEEMADSVESIKELFRSTANDVLKQFPDLKIWDYVKEAVDTGDGLSDEEIDAILNLDYLRGDVWYDVGTEIVTKLADQIKESSAAADAGLAIDQDLANSINQHASLALGAAQQLAAAIQATLAGAQIAGIGSYGLGMGRAVYPSAGRSASAPSTYSGMINNQINIDGKQIASYMTPFVSQNMASTVRATRPR